MLMLLLLSEKYVVTSDRSFENSAARSEQSNKTDAKTTSNTTGASNPTFMSWLTGSGKAAQPENHEQASSAQSTARNQKNAVTQPTGISLGQPTDASEQSLWTTTLPPESRKPVAVPSYTAAEAANLPAWLENQPHTIKPDETLTTDTQTSSTNSILTDKNTTLNSDTRANLNAAQQPTTVLIKNMFSPDEPTRKASRQAIIAQMKSFIGIAKIKEPVTLQKANKVVTQADSNLQAVQNSTKSSAQQQSWATQIISNVTSTLKILVSPATKTASLKKSAVQPAKKSTKSLTPDQIYQQSQEEIHTAIYGYTPG